MDNEKDLYIKEKLQKDELISKKAEDVFANFKIDSLKIERNDMKVENEEKVQAIEDRKEEIPEIGDYVKAETQVGTEYKTESKTTKLSQKKKFLSIAASLVIIFFAANAYAATQGYNNIFFIIKNMFAQEQVQVNNPDDILVDRETLISYQSIEMIKGVKLQINKLVVKDNNAILSVRVGIEENSTNLGRFIVYDVTTNKELLANEEVLHSAGPIEYTQEIVLDGLTKASSKLQFDVKDEMDTTVLSLEIDLNNKEINIISAQGKEMQKISEVELKEALGSFARVNMFKDKGLIQETYTEEEYKNEAILAMAIDEISLKSTTNINEFKEATVKSVLKELIGEEYNNKTPASKTLLEYNNKSNSYKYVSAGCETANSWRALCLEVENISYYNGIYTATFAYCYPNDNDYENGTIEELAVYRASIDFKLNEDYKYSQFCAINIRDVKSECVKEESRNDNNQNSSGSTNNNNWGSNSNSNNNSNNNSSNNNSNNNNYNYGNNNSSNIDISKIDNYASTMRWNTEVVTGTGIKMKVPADWYVEKNTETDIWHSPGGKVAMTVTGIATGINKETNEIVKSNVLITVYEPEFFDSKQQFFDKINTSGNLDSYVGGGSAITTNAGVEFAEGHKYGVALTSDGTRYFCTTVNTSSSVIGYYFTVESDNFANYKLTNIINWMLPTIEFGSF